jgi:hypothetical protein
MAYFNHAFKKTFLATGADIESYPVSVAGSGTVTVSTKGALLMTEDVPTYVLNELSQGVKKGLVNNFSPFDGSLQYNNGYVGIFNPKTNLSLNGEDLPGTCCNIYIAGSAIYSNDKIGPFHGGYQETNKSKMINPKYVSRFYFSEGCPASNEVVHVGSTYYTAGGAITQFSDSQTEVLTLAPNLTNVLINLEGGTGTGAQVIVSTDNTGAVISLQVVYNQNPSNGNYVFGKGYTVGDVLTIPGLLEGTFELTVDAVTEAGGNASCCKTFLCGETYSLRLDIKGSPALRYLNHNAYLTADAYTGCCPADSIAPVAVDSTEVMIKWANAILDSPIVNPFVRIIVQDQAGVLWYEPGTSAADLAILGANTWDNYVSPGYVEGACAGLIFDGAYVDTKFGDCTFQVSDFYEKEPVKLYFSEVDLNGDPCTFDGICVVHECLATQANGLGETVLRDLILSESYRQNFVATDLRIREITQGNQIISDIDRNALYDRLYLQHNVPRFNNPTGVFDNDQYLLEFVGLRLPGNSLDALGQVLGEWLSGCGVCELEEYKCASSCTSEVTFPPLPPKSKRGNVKPGEGFIPRG